MDGRNATTKQTEVELLALRAIRPRAAGGGLERSAPAGVRCAAGARRYSSQREEFHHSTGSERKEFQHPAGCSQEFQPKC